MSRWAFCRCNSRRQPSPWLSSFSARSVAFNFFFSFHFISFLKIRTVRFPYSVGLLSERISFKAQAWKSRFYLYAKTVKALDGYILRGGWQAAWTFIKLTNPKNNTAWCYVEDHSRFRHSSPLDIFHPSSQPRQPMNHAMNRATRRTIDSSATRGKSVLNEKRGDTTRNLSSVITQPPAIIQFFSRLALFQPSSPRANSQSQSRGMLFFCLSHRSLNQVRRYYKFIILEAI